MPINNRLRAMQDFIELSLEWNYLTKGYVNNDILKFQTEHYSAEERSLSCISLYTKESFFYHILNQALRSLKSPFHSYYVRLPFQDLFKSVYQLYQAQKQEEFRKKDFKCYRGCKLSAEELDFFENSIGGYVQLEGFISASLKEDIAVNHAMSRKYEAIIEISVKEDNMGGAMDWGFAYLRDYSSHASEEEVLFNPINVFKVVSFSRKDKKKIHDSSSRKSYHYCVSTIRLEYATMHSEEHYSNGELTNFKHQEELIGSGLRNQGEAFLLCG